MSRGAEVSRLGERLSPAEGLNAGFRALATRWRDVREKQARFVEAIQALLIARAHSLARDPDLPRDLREFVRVWIDHHHESTDFVEEAIRTRPGQALDMPDNPSGRDAGP